MLDVWDAVLALHDCRTFLPGAIRIPFTNLEVIRDIRVGLRQNETGYLVLLKFWMDYRCLWADPKFRIDHWVQHFILNID